MASDSTTCLQPGFAALLLSQAFVLIVAIPILMAVLAAMLRSKLQRLPFVAPTDLFGAILIADLSIVVDPSLILPLIGDQAVRPLTISTLHSYGVMLGVLAWTYCILSVEPKLESLARRVGGANPASVKIPFPFVWLGMYTGVMALLGVHYFVYSYCKWPNQ